MPRAVRLTCLTAIALATVTTVSAQTPTFNRDIAPILFAHCAACHRPGEIGPFSLLTYRDARQHLTQIVDATTRRVMPPWKPEHNGPRFMGDRSLTDAQIAAIQAWAKAGAPEGDKNDLPPAPPAPVDGWQLGTPDLVITMPAAYTLVPEGADVFRTFVLPIPTTSLRYVKAIEFRPGNARAVHHANIGVDRTRSSRRLDAADAEIGYAGGMVRDASYPPGYMLGWTPGQRPRPSPDGMAWALEPDSDLVVQLHMQPTGKTESIQASAAFYFTDERPAHTPVGIRLGSETIEIPAGAREHVITDRYTLPVDVDLLAVQPHAHNLGRVMEATATLPDGATQPIITIRDWDFRWQDVYRYETPMRLPKGTTVSMKFTYDNSTDNPRNLSRPPKPVVWGQNTTDEMGDLWLQVVPVADRDLGTLLSDVTRKTLNEDIAAYTKIMRADPHNPLRHDVVGTLHLQAGRTAVAAAEFRESLRLNPDSAPTHYNLGLALSIARNYSAAMAEFEAAIRLDPAHAEAYNNLGAMQHLFGQLDQAAASYAKAFELNPGNADAHNNLARLLLQQGKYAESAGQFEKALAIAPEAVQSLWGLALVRASAPDAAVRQPEQALTLATRAEALAPRDPSVVDTLAIAYAANGNFEQAVKKAQEAMALADSLNMQSLWVDFRTHLQQFERRTPVIAK